MKCLGGGGAVILSILSICKYNRTYRTHVMGLDDGLPGCATIYFEELEL